jgi:hypothetical protein
MSKIASRKIRIGSGAGYSGDRIEPAVELAEKGNLDYLVFECLAERTIAIALQNRRRDPTAGYDPLLVQRMEACLPVCYRKGIGIITNMGAANPESAVEKTAEIAGNLGLKGLKLAAVSGDDVMDLITRGDFIPMEGEGDLEGIRDRIISANAYLGAGPVVEALANDARVIITGRVADPALFMAPAIHEFGWSFSNYDLLGKGTILGHLLECAGQLTGGYFADPGYNEVPGITRLGFPLAEVSSDGTYVLTKVSGAGGMLTTATCKQQLLYEVGDPGTYISPDVIADFSRVHLKQLEKDRVEVNGGLGREKTGMLKVSVGYRDSFIGEGQISYGGPGAIQRAKLAQDIVRQRFRDMDLQCLETRFDLIGVNSLYGDRQPLQEPYEVRVRVAARTDSMEEAIRVGNEVETLYTNGPAGGGGATKSAREIIAIKSVLIREDLVKPIINYMET